jgi:hypothetical protein
LAVKHKPFNDYNIGMMSAIFVLFESLETRKQNTIRLGPGLLTRSATTIFGSLVQYFVREFGYDALHIKGMPYDWRLSPDMLEVQPWVGTGHGRHGRRRHACVIWELGMGAMGQHIMLACAAGAGWVLHADQKAHRSDRGTEPAGTPCLFLLPLFGLALNQLVLKARCRKRQSVITLLSASFTGHTLTKRTLPL